MNRTLNFTGRRRILREEVGITLRQTSDGWVFDAELRLAAHRFPGNAEVWVEAERGNQWMSFSYGTISMPRVPSDRRLTEFRETEGVKFRIRVALPPGPEHHKLVGEADGIRFVKAGDTNDRRRPLLEPYPADLGQLLWKLDFENGEPRLCVHEAATPSWKQMAESPWFLALVYPEVLRQILTAALLGENAFSDEDEAEDDWPAHWVRFARRLVGSSPLPSVGEKAPRREWIEEAVGAFARLHSSRDMLDGELNPKEKTK